MHQTFVLVTGHFGRSEKHKRNWPAIGKTRIKTHPPPGSVLKTQKRDLLCVGNFFASGLFRAALIGTQSWNVRFVPKADIGTQPRDVRFCAKSRKYSGVTAAALKTS